MLVDIPQEDFEFLKELQHELNTQDIDGNAQPVFWGVIEEKETYVPEDCGDYKVITYDDGRWTLEEAIEEVDSLISEYAEEIQNEWKELDKSDISDVYNFMKDYLMDDIALYDVVKEDVLNKNTGAFLTKRACKQYCEKYSYNHNNPHTYAMTAYRNFELERLLKILRTLKLDGQLQEPGEQK